MRKKLQAGSRQQHEGQGDFGNDERVAQARAAGAASGRAAALFHGGCGIHAGGVNRGRQAEQQRGKKGDAQGKEQDIHVDGYVGFAGKRERRRESYESAYHAVAERQSQRAASAGDQQVLGEQLADEPPTAGAQRSADGYFPFAGCAARQREVRQVRTANQENRADRGQQHK